MCQKLLRWKNTQLEHLFATSLKKVSISLCCRRKKKNITDAQIPWLQTAKGSNVEAVYVTQSSGVQSYVVKCYCIWQRCNRNRAVRKSPLGEINEKCKKLKTYFCLWRKLSIICTAKFLGRARHSCVYSFRCILVFIWT